MIPGNHDVGDKPIAWGPSGTVRDDFLAAWTKHFGEQYFCLEHDGMAFIGINAQLLGSGLAMECEFLPGNSDGTETSWKSLEGLYL